MCHTCESHHSPKNIVPCIKIRYSVKKFSRLMLSRQATLASKIPCTVGWVCTTVCLYNWTSLTTVQGILEAKVACLEGINLENFFTEYLIFMHGTIFLGVWCDSQVWHTLVVILIGHCAQSEWLSCADKHWRVFAIKYVKVSTHWNKKKH